MTDYSNRGFYGRLPRSMQDRMKMSDSGWQDKHEPESQSYYSRLSDGNYYRLSGIYDGLPDVIMGGHIIIMKQRTLNWNGTLPNRILINDVKYMQKMTGVLPNGDTPMIDAEGNTMIIDDAHFNNKESLETVRQYFANTPCEKYNGKELDNGTARRMKRLETENRYYKDLSKKHQQMYIGAGQRIKELTAEVERLRQLVPITININDVKNKSDVTRRFATMDMV